MITLILTRFHFRNEEAVHHQSITACPCVAVYAKNPIVIAFFPSFFLTSTVPGRDVGAPSWHSQAVSDKITFTLSGTKERTPGLPEPESTPYKQDYVSLHI